MSDVKQITIKPQVDEFVFPDGHSVILLSEGRLLNLGNATGHPSFVMSASFSNQVLAQIELHNKSQEFSLGVTTLQKELDEKVARLHLDALGVRLTELTEGQAEYLNPIELLGTRKEEYTIDKYKNFVSSTFKSGASLIGGCCEVKPRHIEAIKDLF